MSFTWQLSPPQNLKNLGQAHTCDYEREKRKTKQGAIERERGMPFVALLRSSFRSRFGFFLLCFALAASLWFNSDPKSVWLPRKLRNRNERDRKFWFFCVCVSLLDLVYGINTDRFIWFNWVKLALFGSIFFSVRK